MTGKEHHQEEGDEGLVNVGMPLSLIMLIYTLL